MQSTQRSLRWTCRTTALRELRPPRARRSVIAKARRRRAGVANFKQRVSERRAARQAKRDERRKRGATDHRKTPRQAMRDEAKKPPQSGSGAG
jgi:hypothetical protein